MLERPEFILHSQVIPFEVFFVLSLTVFSRMFSLLLSHLSTQIWYSAVHILDKFSSGI